MSEQTNEQAVNIRHGVRVRECPCSRPVKGAYLCRVCTGALRDLLTRVPGLLRDLWVTASRLDHVVSVSQVRSHLSGRLLPLRLEALECAAALKAAAGPWVPADAPRIAANAWGPAYHADLAAAVAAAMTMVDLPAELIHLGACGHVEAGIACEQEIFVTADTGSVMCEVCGTLWDVQARRTGKISSAWDAYAYPPVIVRALRTQGVTVTVKQIQNWVALGHLLGVDDGKGRPLYQVAAVYAVADRMLKRRHAARSV